MDELQETVETLIELDEPEALLATLQRAAQRKKGERWQRLALVLAQAQVNYDVDDWLDERAAQRAEKRERDRDRAGTDKPADSEAKPE